MKDDPPRLDAGLLETAPIADEQAFAADGASGVRGRYSTFEFVLRLSQPIHARLASGLNFTSLTAPQEINWRN